LWSFADFQEPQQRIDRVEAWGTAADQPLYDILDFGLLADDSAWAEIRQYRNGSHFRETRFYQLQNGQWQRAGADLRFWSNAEPTADTAHFHVTYNVEDRDLVVRLMTQFEQDYEQICVDFACPVRERQCVTALGQPWCSVYAREYTPTLHLHGPSANVTIDGLNFELPSPRILGLYESSQSIHYDDPLDIGAVPAAQVWYRAYGTEFFRRSLIR
jgi:hypothetical protein